MWGGVGNERGESKVWMQALRWGVGSYVPSGECMFQGSLSPSLCYLGTCRPDLIRPCSVVPQLRICNLH